MQIPKTFGASRLKFLCPTSRRKMRCGAHEAKQKTDMIFQLCRINNESTGESSRTSASGNRLVFFAGGVKTSVAPFHLRCLLRKLSDFFTSRLTKPILSVGARHNSASSRSSVGVGPSHLRPNFVRRAAEVSTRQQMSPT